MRSEPEIREQLNIARSGGTDYDDGVWEALAWAIGESEDPPYPDDSEEEDDEDDDAEDEEDEDGDEG